MVNIKYLLLHCSLKVYIIGVKLTCLLHKLIKSRTKEKKKI